MNLVFYGFWLKIVDGFLENVFIKLVLIFFVCFIVRIWILFGMIMFEILFYDGLILLMIKEWFVGDVMRDLKKILIFFIFVNIIVIDKVDNFLILYCVMEEILWI